VLIRTEIAGDELDILFHIHTCDDDLAASGICLKCGVESDIFLITGNPGHDNSVEKSPQPYRWPCLCSACKNNFPSDYFFSSRDFDIIDTEILVAQLEFDSRLTDSKESMLSKIVQVSIDEQAANIFSRICEAYRDKLFQRASLADEILGKGQSAKSFNKLYDRLALSLRKGEILDDTLKSSINKFSQSVSLKFHHSLLENPMFQQKLWSDTAGKKFEEIKQSFAKFEKDKTVACKLPVLLSKFCLIVSTHSGEGYDVQRVDVVDFFPVVVKKNRIAKGSSVVLKSKNIYNDIPGLNNLI
jgi:hypothetical protein